MTIALLSLIGVLEAIAYAWRYRSAVKGASPTHAGLSTVATQSLRMCWLGAGVTAKLQSDLVLGGLAYVASASIVTFAVQWWVDHRSKA